MSEKAIRVELSDFCQSFSAVLDPFANSLGGFIQTVQRVESDDALQPLLSPLLDNQHRLKILRDKARQQNTYLVIFGPLKSGKSTLMNAISGAYVSEVSSLPAYPCLVYVHEGEERKLSLTRFNGRETTYHSPAALEESIEKAHTELAGELRRAEEEGRSFSPAQDFDEAIRRIDFTLPAPSLRESGTILVDTPGLYTKMKYNYGQLTRDFRDTAACAVFVVKTDNLFFEQVFDEFADLLGVFSRVFLVVNIDSSKRDLGPSGDLQPALETKDPRKILEAFENLTVSAQIRSAIESGQLRIYLIDLLQTAVHRLRNNQEDTDGSTDSEAYKADAEENQAGAEESGQDEASELEPPADEADASESDPWATREGGSAEGPTPTSVEHSQVGFESFLNDLTDYLNSSDYILSFKADSLRQARSVLDETEEQIASQAVASFQEKSRALKEEADAAEGRLHQAQFLTKDRWNPPLEAMINGLREKVEGQLKATAPDLKSDLRRELDAWFETDESMKGLLVGRMEERVAKACRNLRKQAADSIDNEGRSRNAGVKFSSEMQNCIRDLDLSLDGLYPEFQAKVESRLTDSPTLPDPAELQEELPVRKTILDWILFRSPASVRRRLLGDEAPSEMPIPAGAKAKRLGEEGKENLADAMERYADNALHTTVEQEADAVLNEYSAFLASYLSKAIAKRETELKNTCEHLRRDFETRDEALRELDGLGEAVNKLRDGIASLHTRFVGDKGNLDSLPESSEDPNDVDDADAEE